LRAGIVNRVIADEALARALLAEGKETA
jgi:hypothetical protein